MKALYILLILIFHSSYFSLLIAQSSVEIKPDQPTSLNNGATIGYTGIGSPGTVRTLNGFLEVFQDGQWNKVSTSNPTPFYLATSGPNELWVTASQEAPCAKTCPWGYAATENAQGYVCKTDGGSYGTNVSLYGYTTGFAWWGCGGGGSGGRPLGRCYCVKIL